MYEIQLDVQHGEIARTSLQIEIIRILLNDYRTLHYVGRQQFSRLRLPIVAVLVEFFVSCSVHWRSRRCIISKTYVLFQEKKSNNYCYKLPFNLTTRYGNDTNIIYQYNVIRCKVIGIRLWWSYRRNYFDILLWIGYKEIHEIYSIPHKEMTFLVVISWCLYPSMTITKSQLI